MRAEDAVEDGIHMAKLALQIEGMSERFRIEVLRDRCRAQRVPGNMSDSTPPWRFLHRL